MNNSFFENNIFKNKSALIIIPHQDDEINICGPMIKNLVLSSCEIYVLYSTNGDNIVNASRRIKEGLKSLKTLGVKKSNIYFLGYSDQYSSNDKHLYMTLGDSVWCSNKHRTETYLPSKYGEEFRYCESKEHSKFNQKSLVKDLKDFICKYKTDYIFTIDFDSHPDHRALSLAFEKAMGMILTNSGNTYHPIIYKGFAYPTCFFGVADLFQKNSISTKFDTEKFSISNLENPYYNFEERIRFPILKQCYTYNILFNSIYKALRCHESQLIIKKAESIINNDQIYWQRRTDSLTYNADILVSSGESKYLNDFMYFDCKDIMHGNTKMPTISANAWIPNKDDKNPNITFNFKNSVEVEKIVFYQQCEYEGHINKIEICYNGKKEIIEFNNKNTLVYEYKLSKIEHTNQLILNIIDVDGINYGFSEIEIYNYRKYNEELIKMKSNDDFIYNLYFDSGVPIDVYSYNGEKSQIKQINDYYVKTSNIYEKNNKYYLKNKNKEGYILITSKNNKDLYDKIYILPYTFSEKIINNFLLIFNKNLHKINVFLYRLIRKIKKILYQKKY